MVEAIVWYSQSENTSLFANVMLKNKGILKEVTDIERSINKYYGAAPGPSC